MKSRTAVILTGPCGWGEFAPFAEYGPAESSWWLESAVEAAFVGWPPPVRTAVGVNAIVPGVGPTQAAELAAAAAVSGARTIKIKVAGVPAGQWQQTPTGWPQCVVCSAGRSGSMPTGRGPRTRRWPRCGCSTGSPADWNTSSSRVRTWLDWPRSVADVPVAADESIRRAADPIAAVKAAAVDVVVLKVPPLGGVRRALAVAAAAGVPVVVSSAIDTGVGLAAGVAFAAALPELQHDCGLGTATLVVDDVVAPAPIPVGGRLPLTSGAPDPESLWRALQPA